MRVLGTVFVFTLLHCKCITVNRLFLLVLTKLEMTICGNRPRFLVLVKAKEKSCDSKHLTHAKNKRRILFASVSCLMCSSKALAKPVYLRTSRRVSFHMSKSRTMFGHQRLQCSLSFHMLSLRQTGRAGRRTIFCYANRQKLTNSTLIKTLPWCAFETKRPYLLS